jgi:hypothetical protein
MPGNIYGASTAWPPDHPCCWSLSRGLLDGAPAVRELHEVPHAAAGGAGQSGLPGAGAAAIDARCSRFGSHSVGGLDPRSVIHAGAWPQPRQCPQMGTRRWRASRRQRRQHPCLGDACRVARCHSSGRRKKRRGMRANRPHCRHPDWLRMPDLLWWHAYPVLICPYAMGKAFPEA